MKPTKISYISSFQGAVQTADVVWHSCEYGIYPAVVEFYVPSRADIPQQQLFISADGKNWYAYTLYDQGLASFFVRESALPMEVNDDGYPVSQAEKLIRRFSE